MLLLSPFIQRGMFFTVYILVGEETILCSVFLPQLLELQRPGSSVLLSTASGLCKRHPAAALELGLVLRKVGLNVPQPGVMC